MTVKEKRCIVGAVVIGSILGIVGNFIPLFTFKNIFLSLSVSASLLFLYVLGNKFLYRKILMGAPFVKSNDGAVKTMVEFADIRFGQKTVDLGSGDGNIVVAFAKKGAVATGYELSPLLVLLSKLKARKMKRVHINKQSLWNADFSKYDTITLFGVGYIMEMIEKKLRKEARSGTKFISNRFPLPNTKHVTKKDGVFLYKLKHTKHRPNRSKISSHV